MDEGLPEAIERSLGPWANRAAGVLAAMGRPSLAQLEASVRGGAAGLRGSRMMVEGLSPDVAHALLAALSPALGPCSEALLALARREGVPIIAGWDAAAGVVKVYLNATDASDRLRRRYAAALAGFGPDAPHVIGVNLGTGGETLKVYRQHPGLPPSSPRALVAWAEGRRLAGGVECVARYETGARLRACFAALRSGEENLGRGLSGWDGNALSRLAPFEPGRVTTLGMDASGRRWTVYFKPKGLTESSSPWRIDPDAVFRHPTGEVGIYLEPKETASRAYGTAGPYAVSYRPREGRVAGPEIDRLMTWVLRQLAEGASQRLEDPPGPWVRVDGCETEGT